MMVKKNAQAKSNSNTVKPPIMDSPRYGPPPYNRQTMCPQLTLP